MGHRHSYETLAMAAEYVVLAHHFTQINQCEDCFSFPAPFQIYIMRESGEPHINRPYHIAKKYNKRGYNQNGAKSGQNNV